MKFCSVCGTPMEIRQSSDTYFWRCMAFPACRKMEIIPDLAKLDLEAIQGNDGKGAISDVQDFEDMLELGEEQQTAYDLLENTDTNLFITGRAGTGKSVLLKYFVRHTAKRVVVLAPTGVAAMNVFGQTLHSFFAFDHSALEPKDVVINKETAQILKHTDAIIIDETSIDNWDLTIASGQYKDLKPCLNKPV